MQHKEMLQQFLLHSLFIGVWERVSIEKKKRIKIPTITTYSLVNTNAELETELQNFCCSSFLSAYQNGKIYIGDKNDNNNNNRFHLTLFVARLTVLH